MIKNVISPATVEPFVMVANYRTMEEKDPLILSKLTGRRHIKHDINLILDDDRYNPELDGESYTEQFIKWESYIINKTDIVILGVNEELENEVIVDMVSSYIFSPKMINKYLFINCEKFIDNKELLDQLVLLSNNDSATSIVILAENEDQFYNLLNHTIEGISSLDLFTFTSEGDEEVFEEVEEQQEFDCECYEDCECCDHHEE